MIFGNDRDALRRQYHEAWRKAQAGTPLSPLEAQIAAVIELHPEYHGVIGGEDTDADYLPESGQTNPYLHMGLHLGLRDQLATNRPPGIRAIHERLVVRTGDAHDAEHRMIECLAETLWEAQGSNAPPDESRYLERLRKL